MSLRQAMTRRRKQTNGRKTDSDPVSSRLRRQTRSIIPIRSILLTSMIYDTRGVKSSEFKLEGRQQVQKEHFDRSSKLVS